MARKREAASDMKGHKYEYDIFLSYSRRIDTRGWVTTFGGVLEDALKEKPVVGDVRIFKDTKSIDGGRRFDKEIERSLARSAVLIIIMSEAYLDSKKPWCAKEREYFIKKAGGADGADGRIYIVNYDDIHPSKLPKEINRFTPYTFFKRDENTGVIAPVALQERDGRLYKGIFGLRDDLIGAFKSIGAPAVGGKAIKQDEKRPVVFLAEALPGEVEQGNYERVASAITQNADVVPGSPCFYSAGEGFEKEIDGFLTRADLFVQLLTKQKWPQSPNFEKGYERWLFDKAKQRNTPILRWRSPDLDLSQIQKKDKDHYDFLLLSDPLFGDPRVCDLPEFIPMISNAVKEQKIRNKYGLLDDGCPVLVLGHNQDASLCDSVGEELEEYGSCKDAREIEAELMFPEKEAVFRREAAALSPRGLIVVWDEGPVDRLYEFMRTCRRYKKKRSLDPPACAVVVPSFKSHPVNRHPPGFDIISMDKGQLWLEQFVKRVCGELS